MNTLSTIENLNVCMQYFMLSLTIKKITSDIFPAIKIAYYYDIKSLPEPPLTKQGQIVFVIILVVICQSM